MKIGIIDTDHYFYIYSLIRLFENSDTEITLYINPKVYKRCEVDLADRKDIKYVVQAANESWGEFLERNVDSINTAGYSYLFLCPLYEHYKEHYQFISKLKTLNIMVVFNLNGWVNPALIRTSWFWETFYKRKIYKLIDWIAIDEHFHDHALKLGCRKNILHIPSLLYDPEYVAKWRSKTNSPVKIIVPGSIDPDRRDYDVVLDALSIVLNERQDLEVVLLGDPIGEYGKKIHERTRTLNKKFGKQIFKIFERKYSDDEFLKEMISGHFLIAPVLPEFKLDGIIEVYGTSKSTGSCFDILAYAIPGVFPKWLSINSRFKSSTLRYENAAELSAIILDLVDHPDKLEQLRAVALENSSYYAVANVKTRLMKSLPTSKI